MAAWYPPGGHDPEPWYAGLPIIPVHDLASPKLGVRRKRFWKKALTAALMQWESTPLSFPRYAAPGYTSDRITIDIVDVQDGTRAQADFGRTPPLSDGTQFPLPGVGWVHVSPITFEQLFRARTPGGLTKIIAHEVGHCFGFAHGGTGAMSTYATGNVNAEEISALRLYFYPR